MKSHVKEMRFIMKKEVAKYYFLLLMSLFVISGGISLIDLLALRIISSI